MLRICCLSFAEEEKKELGLLLGAEFIPRATTTSNQKLSFGRSVAYSVDYARRLSSGNTGLLLEFPFAAAPSHRVQSSQPNAITNAIGRRIDVALQLKLLLPIGFRGEVRGFHTLNTRSFGVPVQRTQQHNVVVSEDWLSTINGLRRGSPLVNMEDRMLDHLADHKRNCQHRSHERNGKAEFLTQRHWLLSPASGRPVSGTPGVPQYQ